MLTNFIPELLHLSDEGTLSFIPELLLLSDKGTLVAGWVPKHAQVEDEQSSKGKPSLSVAICQEKMPLHQKHNFKTTKTWKIEKVDTKQCPRSISADEKIDVRSLSLTAKSTALQPAKNYV